MVYSLTSVTPSTFRAGQTIALALVGVDFVTPMVASIGDLEADSCTRTAATTATATFTIPAGFDRGELVLTVDSNDGADTDTLPVFVRAPGTLPAGERRLAAVAADLYAARRRDGSVRLVAAHEVAAYKPTAAEMTEFTGEDVLDAAIIASTTDHTLAPDLWASLVSRMSKQGPSAAAFEAALRLQNIGP